MASTSTKRPAESEQSVDSYAVCNSCSRLSRNLGNCDKCGSTLSEDNAAVCYSVDPKRARLDSSTPPPNGVNGESNSTQDSGAPPTNSAPATSVLSSAADTATTTTTDSSTVSSSSPPTSTADKPANGTASPSPPATISSDDTVRPSALFANVNNITRKATTPPVDTSATSIPANLTVNIDQSAPPPPYPGLVPTPTTTASISNSHTSRSSTAPGPPPPLQQSGPRVSLPSYNLQPAAPASITPSSAPTYGAGANKPSVGGAAASAGPRIPDPPGLTPQTAGGGGHAVSITRDNVLIPAQQIRIGSQKFKPLSPVTFKDDGILFTLKDYTYAPVLLNARAIIKCKANLNFKEYPVFLLQLESSCMRQIRNIFGLKDDEFSENFGGPFEIKRCITIFPTIANSQYTPAEITAALMQVFGTMELRYRRYNKIVEEITPEDAVDILLAPVGVRSGPAPAATPPRPAPPAQAPAPRSMAQRTMPQPQPMHWPTPGLPPTAVGRVPPPPIPQPGGSMVRPEGTLTIPADPARWEQMQRSLQVGGVYHVQMNNGQKKYCLWNGTQLVPCFVQNTEVQLECGRVRIGSLKAVVNSSVRIKLDNNCGIFFTVTAHGVGTKQLQISTDDILSAFACFENMSRLFIYLKWSGADKLRTLLKMSRKDPTYDPNAGEERRKHMIFTLHNINADQKEALVQMRLPGQQRAFFESLPLMKALKILSDVQKNSSVQSTLERFLNGKEPVPNRMKLVQIATQVEQELQRDDNTQDMVDDDDDDDVIMTEEEVGVKCPYTQQVMKEPIRNKVCGHNYENVAIQEFMSRKKGVAKCPYAGCGNRAPLKPEDMEENPELKAYIKKMGPTT